MAPARAVEIVCAVLSALGEAHRLGILHRDVKPSNVLFDDMGAARLSDFGAAHLGDLSSTATAGAIGTFAYMSPEQRRGHPAGIASDLYGAGVLLAELLTGVTPSPVSQGLDPLPSASHPDLTEAHDRAVARLLQEDPRKRPTDAFEARRLLLGLAWPERIWEHAPEEARPRTDRPPPSASARLTASLAPAGDARDAAIRRHDTWLERDVLVLASDEATLSLARAFARAGHPALPTVLRVDRDEGAIWIAAPLGQALAGEPRGLSPGAMSRVREAIEALHAAGGAHGHIDPEHLYWLDGEVTLAFPRGDAPADAAARDREALARLGCPMEATETAAPPAGPGSPPS
jgi:serine/threonine-protein kinase